ncbi:MAG: hypothetical protein WCS51_04300 [Bacilli bacterium]
MTKISMQTKILSVIIAIIFLITNLGINYIIIKKNSGLDGTSASSSSYSSAVTLSNSNFTSFTSSSTYPKSPSSWTRINSQSTVTAGVIDVDASTFESNKEDYELTNNPETATTSLDDYILMLNASESSNDGYSSSDITISANKFYIISFNVLTMNISSNGASAYLVNSDDEIIGLPFANFVTSYNSNYAWNTYSFIIATGSSSETVNLELWLGSRGGEFKSSGAVFYDNVVITETSENAVNLSQNYTDTTTKFIDLRDDYVEKISNSGFENALSSDNWQRITTGADYEFDTDYCNTGVTALTADNFDSITTGISQGTDTNYKQTLKFVSGTATYVTNYYGLYINNIIETRAGYTSNSFSVERFSAYKISVWVKTGALSSNGATIVLSQVVEDDEEVAYTQSFTGIDTSSTTDSLTNDWVEYTFYVLGNEFETVDMGLQLWVGSDSTDTRGYAFFDEIRISEISLEDYNAVSTSDTAKTLQLTSLEDPDIANATFNSITDNVSDSVYNPKSWEFYSSIDDENQYSGIINTNSSLYNNNEYGLVANPGVLPSYSGTETINTDYNNILMVRNAEPQTQYFESEEITLDANSVYAISVYANSASGTEDGFIKLMTSDDILLTSFTNITSSSWNLYTFYVNTSYDSLTIKIQLGLGNDDDSATGWVFFDNLKSETSDSELVAITQNNYNKTVDLSVENFNTTTGSATNGIYSTNYWSGNNNGNTNSQIIAGVLDGSQSNIFNVDIEPLDEENPNVMVIHSGSDTYYSMINAFDYTLTADSYYKVEVIVKTVGLSQSIENQTTDDDDEIYIFGASIDLSNLDGLTAINTNGEWKTYTFYVKTGSSSITTNLSISLGDENALTSGTVFIDTVQLSNIEETVYEDGVEDAKDDDLVMVIDDSADDDEEEEETEATSADLSLIDISGMIIVLALVIAIVGTIIKRNKKQETVVVERPVYNRDAKFDGKGTKEEQEENAKLARIAELKVEIVRLDKYLSALNIKKIETEQLIQDNPHDKNALKQLEAINNELKYNSDNLKAVKEELIAQQEIFNKQFETK